MKPGRDRGQPRNRGAKGNSINQNGSTTTDRRKKLQQKCQGQTFQLGDWVLRKAFQNTKNQADGKLAPSWEGPYKITQVVGNGANQLTDQKGNPVPRSWKATHLRKYYF
uniref:Uncharacterized protein n=1 Tax=Chenopodium quinoa TaxID=63459 RepID=A0A803N315_CHEQI